MSCNNVQKHCWKKGSSEKTHLAKHCEIEDSTMKREIKNFVFSCSLLFSYLVRHILFCENRKDFDLLWRGSRVGMQISYCPRNHLETQTSRMLQLHCWICMRASKVSVRVWNLEKKKKWQDICEGQLDIKANAQMLCWKGGSKEISTLLIFYFQRFKGIRNNYLINICLLLSSPFVSNHSFNYYN